MVGIVSHVNGDYHGDLDLDFEEGAQKEGGGH